jgi:hypothetical protein
MLENFFGILLDLPLLPFSINQISRMSEPPLDSNDMLPPHGY